MTSSAACSRRMDLVTGTLRRQQTNIGAMVNQGQQLIGEFVTATGRVPRNDRGHSPIWYTR